MAREHEQDRDRPTASTLRSTDWRSSGVSRARRPPLRRARVGAARRAHRRSRKARLRAARRRVPEELVAERDQHRRPEVLPRPARHAAARALRQADGRPRRRHDRALGPRGRLLRVRATTRDAFEAELTHILVNQQAAFNSPVWFNVGFEESPQCSACFILSVEDTMESILDWNTKEGMIFRGGSGSGINLSKIRSSKEQLSKGGYASGPVSFMRGADAWAGTIKSRRQDAARGQDGRARRRPPRHPRLHLVQGEGGGQGGRACRRPASTCRSTARASTRSSTRTRTTRCA